MTASTVFHQLDRNINLQEALDDLVQRAESEFNARGFATTEIHDALTEVLHNRRMAYAEDPDPAEDGG